MNVKAKPILDSAWDSNLPYDLSEHQRNGLRCAFMSNLSIYTDFKAQTSLPASYAQRKLDDESVVIRFLAVFLATPLSALSTFLAAKSHNIRPLVTAREVLPLKCANFKGKRMLKCKAQRKYHQNQE